MAWASPGMRSTPLWSRLKFLKRFSGLPIGRPMRIKNTSKGILTRPLPMQKKKSPTEPKPIVNAVAAASGSGPHVVTTTRKSESFVGPLPHPSTLQQYEKILPGLAERIVSMAESEQRARLDSVKKDAEAKARLLEIADSESTSNRKMTTRGQWIGAAVTFLCIIAAAFFAWSGKSDMVVMCFLAVPTASLIAAFVPGIKKRDKSSK